MKNLFKLIYLSIALSALFGCEKEENGTAQNENFKTVSVDDAIGFLNLRTVKKTNANSYLTNISTDVQQEQITNTDELLTIVPAATIHQQHYSRILLLEIDGEIQSVVFSMTPDESPDSEAYDGELLITDLDGSFIKGYTVENGILQTEYLGFPDVYGKAVTQKNDCTDCPYSVCDFCDLEEVDLGFVGGSSGLPQVNYIVIGSIFDRGNSGGYIDFGWNSGGGGGGSSSPNITPYQGFLNSLTLAQRNFLTANTPLKINIQNFFSENGHNEATESFVTDIIIYLMGNPNIDMSLINSELLSSLSNYQVDPPTENNEITNMSDFLDCIDPSQNATLTIYADQPISGSNLPISSSGDVGHAFVSISQNGNTVVFGFYPQQRAKAFLVADGSIHNNQGDSYDASMTMDISASILDDIINFVSTIPSTYNINVYNCTDYVIDISNFTSHGLPNCWAFYPGGGGSSPSVLGEYIRNLPESNQYTTNTEPSNAPIQSGDCN